MNILLGCLVDAFKRYGAPAANFPSEHEWVSIESCQYPDKSIPDTRFQTILASHVFPDPPLAKDLSGFVLNSTQPSLDCAITDESHFLHGVVFFLIVARTSWTTPSLWILRAWHSVVVPKRSTVV